MSTQQNKSKVRIVRHLGGELYDGWFPVQSVSIEEEDLIDFHFYDTWSLYALVIQQTPYP